MCLGRARRRSECVHCCITHATQCGLTRKHAVLTHTAIVSNRRRSVPAIDRSQTRVHVRPRYSRNTFAVFQVPPCVTICFAPSWTDGRARHEERRGVDFLYERFEAADARSLCIDPVFIMPMADRRRSARASRPGEQAVAKAPQRKCNPIRGDRISAYGDSRSRVSGCRADAGYQAATPPSERGSLPPRSTPLPSRRIAPACPTVSS